MTEQWEEALALGLDLGQGKITTNDSLEELKALALTAGAKVRGVLIQKRRSPDPQTYFGKGKLQDAKAQVDVQKVDLLLVDDELSALQTRNLEQALGVRVVDRTRLILDIFAQHAKSKEGKLQVELAQCLYLLPRLTGKGITLSRLGGGIGTRGPGETRLEERRRVLRDRIAQLKREVKRLKQHRDRLRKSRLSSHHPLLAIVGYTNAGKSTLLNALSRANAYVADQLFATLDPMTRQIFLPSGHYAFLTDTVGFIHKLPHSLIASFYATLEEIRYADGILLVVDVSSPNMEEEIAVTEKILSELGCLDLPRLTVFNKVDKVGYQAPSVCKKYGAWVAVSALRKANLESLKREIDILLEPFRTTLTFQLKDQDLEKLAFLRAYGKIQSCQPANGKVRVKLETLKSWAGFLEKRLS